MRQTMSDTPDDLPKKREGVDPEDIRKALEAQAKKRPSRPPVNEMPPPIPRLRVFKPKSRRNNPHDNPPKAN